MASHGFFGYLRPLSAINVSYGKPRQFFRRKLRKLYGNSRLFSRNFTASFTASYGVFVKKSDVMAFSAIYGYSRQFSRLITDS